MQRDWELQTFMHHAYIVPYVHALTRDHESLYSQTHSPGGGVSTEREARVAGGDVNQWCVLAALSLTSKQFHYQSFFNARSFSCD